MSNLEQMRDNVSFMEDFQPLSPAEREAVDKVCGILRSGGGIPCTACRYCVLENHCPQNIHIPDLFACYNEKAVFHSVNQDFYYTISTRDRGKASDCVACGKCEAVCPQHLPIRELLKKVAGEFEGNK